MKLKALNIVISTKDQFIGGLKREMKSSQRAGKNENSIEFESFETFKRVMSLNKLQLLMGIARFRPRSIYQLAKLVEREFPHVLKDCYALENYGFIKLEEVEGARKQLMPKLIFDYDFIRVKASIEEFHPISERSNNLLLKGQVVNR